ncbi:MAG TPA: alkene reductase, partial [Methanosarcina sp.]|nr:alkene reductase [Methanosarcina sp.]
HNTSRSMSDANPLETFSYFTAELNKTGLGYLHLVEAMGGREGFVPPEARLGPTLRKIFERTFILNGGYNFQSGNKAIASGQADLIAFGVPFLANPDLPERFKQNAPLNEPDMSTYYKGGEKGYTDYQALVKR